MVMSSSALKPSQRGRQSVATRKRLLVIWKNSWPHAKGPYTGFVISWLAARMRKAFFDTKRPRREK